MLKFAAVGGGIACKGIGAAVGRGIVYEGISAALAEQSSAMELVRESPASESMCHLRGNRLQGNLQGNCFL